MQTGKIALGLALSIGSIAAQGAEAQEYRGTWEQQMACTPDVWRLCSDQIPDTNRIVACLQAAVRFVQGFRFACRRTVFMFSHCR